jgi:hypothetical protein
VSREELEGDRVRMRRSDETNERVEVLGAGTAHEREGSGSQREDTLSETAAGGSRLVEVSL